MPSDTSQAMAELAEGLAYELERDPERVQRLLKASAILAGVALLLYVVIAVARD